VECQYAVCCSKSSWTIYGVVEGDGWSAQPHAPLHEQRLGLTLTDGGQLLIPQVADVARRGHRPVADEWLQCTRRRQHASHTRLELRTHATRLRLHATHQRVTEQTNPLHGQWGGLEVTKLDGDVEKIVYVLSPRSTTGFPLIRASLRSARGESTTRTLGLVSWMALVNPESIIAGLCFLAAYSRKPQEPASLSLLLSWSGKCGSCHANSFPPIHPVKE
jgi:hypothetical protein